MSTKMSEQDANKAIAELLVQASQFIAAAETIADENGVDFHWRGPEYGMGGYYTGKKNDWKDSGCSSSDEDETSWHPSSQSC